MMIDLLPFKVYGQIENMLHIRAPEKWLGYRQYDPYSTHWFSGDDGLIPKASIINEALKPFNGRFCDALHSDKFHGIWIDFETKEDLVAFFLAKDSL